MAFDLRERRARAIGDRVVSRDPEAWLAHATTPVEPGR